MIFANDAKKAKMWSSFCFLKNSGFDSVFAWGAFEVNYVEWLFLSGINERSSCQSFAIVV